ncbi:LCP family protein [Ruminiclostridium cellobioparum]|uniref:LCP family protein n=1 Tax=Ruminiclostridium cellobioparum TaxID=29355 RepID=UPI0004890AC2|nr:LCP family protein [Ruminiclostridium cellobioparum]
MKSVKITCLACLICGIILFASGITLLFNIKTAPPSPVVTENSTPSTETKSFDIINNYTGNMNPINFLVLIKEASGSNTDTIIIANYSPQTKQINLLTVPRDTKGTNRSDIKINSFYDMGYRQKMPKGTSELERKHNALKYTAQTISNLTNIKINYYIYLEIDTIKSIVDKLGGIYFDVPAKLKYNDPVQNLHIDLQKGYQLLDGDKTEQLLRFRKPQTRYYTREELKEVNKYYNGSDLKRTEMQINFVNAIIQQKVSLLELPRLIPIVNYAFDNVITNTELNDVLSLLGAFTQGSRPEMNTFKLYGIDKRIAGADFFIYNETVEDTKSRELLRADKVIEQYFTIPSGNFIPDPASIYDFKIANRDNPSNSDTDSVGDNKDKP